MCSNSPHHCVSLCTYNKYGHMRNVKWVATEVQHAVGVIIKMSNGQFDHSVFSENNLFLNLVE